MDRLASGYEPRFDIDVAVGRRGEEYVLEHFSASHEVKNDAKSRVTGNVYIEYGQRRSGQEDYRDSGIRTSEAEFWTYVIGKVIISAPMANWREMVERIIVAEPGLIREMLRGSNPTMGVIVPIDSLTQRLNEANL